MNAPRPLLRRVIGVGNDYRRDDAVGLQVARRFSEQQATGVSVIEQTGEGAALIEAWQGASAVMVIDAVHSGGKPGAIYRFEAHTRPMPANFFQYSTHAFSLAEAIELARTLKRLPPRVVVYGVEGKNFTSGVGLSPEVETAAQEVTIRILSEWRCDPV
jgi:hydrogenase maturation protease